MKKGGKTQTAKKPTKKIKEKTRGLKKMREKIKNILKKGGKEREKS